jgi:hypothetical protein
MSLSVSSNGMLHPMSGGRQRFRPESDVLKVHSLASPQSTIPNTATLVAQKQIPRRTHVQIT